jgi:5'-nucleotidase
MTSDKSPTRSMQDNMSNSMTSTDGAGWGAVRRHVVKHDWRSIRDALFVGRNEHMSDVDDCVSIVCSCRVPCFDER